MRIRDEDTSSFCTFRRKGTEQKVRGKDLKSP